MSIIAALQKKWDDHPDIVKERQSASFDPIELTNLLDGSPEKTNERRRMETFFLSGPNAVAPPDVEGKSPEERYQDAMLRARNAATKLKEYRELLIGEDKYSYDVEENICRALVHTRFPGALYPDGPPLLTHYGMFLPTLHNIGTESVVHNFLLPAFNFEIRGTYAQTELGHGSNVRGLETTATFDPETDEFVIHTPNFLAYKWWPGGLGHTSTHAVVMAQLMTGGESKGIHGFIVPIRNPETGKPLPGIHVGSLSARSGYNTVDNGFVAFDHFRIPRENMLMKTASVDKNGVYTSNKNSKLNYSTLVFTRASVCQHMTSLIQKAATIATRYSAVRRQGYQEGSTQEVQLLDYVTQQAVLFPAIASGIAIHCVANWILEAQLEAFKNLRAGYGDMMMELHAIACALKAVTSSDTAQIAEQCRRAVGGLGLLLNSALPRILVEASVSCTLDGDNTILLLQVARYLVKQHKENTMRASSGRTFAGPHLRTTGAQSSLGLEDIIKAYHDVTKGLVQRACQFLDEKVKDGCTYEEAWSTNSNSLTQCAKAYCRAFIVDKFADSVQRWKCSQALRDVTRRLSELYAIHWLLLDSGDFIRFGGVHPNDIDQLQKRRDQLLLELRPDAVALVDAFDFDDATLGSVLGYRDGRALERLFTQVTGRLPESVGRDIAPRAKL